MIASRRDPGAARARRGMTLVEVVVAIIILAGVLLVLGGFSAKFAQANSQAHLVITANEIAAQRLDEVRTQPTYASIDLLATPAAAPDTAQRDNTTFYRSTRVRRVGGTAPTDSVDYKLLTVIVTHPSMTKPVTKTTAIAAF
jgi:prepilin-type N-terminal cleavage/methylation domain-containing protein